MRAPSPSRRGLTLIEVMAVVVILGLIATTLTLSFRGQVSTAKRQLAKTGIGVICNAVETYSIETGRVPTLEEGLTVLTKPRAASGEPFLKVDNLRDPWGSHYRYVTPGPTGAAGSYEVISLGSDLATGGTPGTDAADLSSEDLGDRRHAQGAGVP